MGKGKKVVIKGEQIPKEGLNFTDQEIKKLTKDPMIMALLRSKRQSDSQGDKITSRKIRRALRAAGFFITLAKESLEGDSK